MKQSVWVLLCIAVAVVQGASVASNSASQVTEASRESSKRIIRLIHSGAFLARFYVSWDEVTLDSVDGFNIITRRNWEDNGQSKAVGFERAIYLDQNCRNISVKIEINYFPQSWTTVIDVAEIPLIKMRTFTVSSWTGRPTYSIVPDVVIMPSAKPSPRKSQIATHGIVRLRQSGGYVGYFYVSWDEVNHDENGHEIVTRKHWEGNGLSRGFGYRHDIHLTANCRNISIKAEEAWFFASYSTVFDVKGLPFVGLRTAEIWGTTLAPKYSIDPAV